MKKKKKKKSRDASLVVLRSARIRILFEGTAIPIEGKIGRKKGEHWGRGLLSSERVQTSGGTTKRLF